MKIEERHIEQIKTAFAAMQTKEDFLHVLNLAKPLVAGENAIPFKIKQISWYSNPKIAQNRYYSFKIKKKSGADRTIHAPVAGLKSIQKTLSFVLQCVFEPHHAAFGFVQKKSIVDNAQIHVGSKFVYNIDLKDFFPSIDQARVWKCLQLPPFNLKQDQSKKAQQSEIPVLKDNIWELGDSLFTIENNWISEVTQNQIDTLANLSAKRDRSKIANIISAICCTELEVERKNDDDQWELVKRNVIPQGAPTSPIITNIICQRLDFLLTGVAKRFGLKYSRYADDITFSSMHNVYQNGSDFLNELHRIIKQQNFHIKESKTRLQKDGYRKEVTGLLVNDKVNVQKRYVKKLRMWLYYWERYGYNYAEEIFFREYTKDKGHLISALPAMERVIHGKLNYLKMVKGEENEMYIKLRNRFSLLSNLGNPIDKIISIWENEGIEKAMLFNKDEK